MGEPFKCGTNGYKYVDEECTHFDKDREVCKYNRSCFFKERPLKENRGRSKTLVEYMVDTYYKEYYKILNREES